MTTSWMTTSWIPLNSDIYDQPRRETIRGVEVELSLPPYDVPEGIRGDLNESRTKFVIEFHYRGSPEQPSEPLETIEVDQFVSVQVGRNSHRLYLIEVDIKSVADHSGDLREPIGNELREAIDRLDRSRRRPKNRGYYQLASRIIQDRKDQLLDALQGVK